MGDRRHLGPVWAGRDNSGTFSDTGPSQKCSASASASTGILKAAAKQSWRSRDHEVKMARKLL